MFLLKFLFYFSISFILLCIPIKHATVFDYLHEFVAPVTQPLFESVRDKTEAGFEESKRIGLKLFSNARPKKQDSVRLKKSSIKKESTNNNHSIHENEYTVEEEDLLKKVLENAY